MNKIKWTGRVLKKLNKTIVNILDKGYSSLMSRIGMHSKLDTVSLKEH
ncbi:hypothetical protein [Wolbachia endosymbiont of Litomosoides brasiliensis]|nr:hypothetical protein [Wolbachia endosymbiont of Litomosoides brasiliensis]